MDATVKIFFFQNIFTKDVYEVIFLVVKPLNNGQPIGHVSLVNEKEGL